MEFVGTFWALVPPIVAIVLALVTKETYSSLFVGILVGALLLAGFDPLNTLTYVVGGTVGEGDATQSVGFVNALADSWNAGIFLFLVMLGIMVALVNSAGGSAAFGAWAARRIKGRVGAQLATFFLGVLIFVDDYFNCLTVGTVMKPVTDGHRVSRAKLSYIIDSTAAPICMIAPISSWAAAVSATAANLDTGVTGIQLFIQSIPYNFYSLLTIVFVLFVIVTGIDYGPMAAAELKAWREGDAGVLEDDKTPGKKHASLWDLLVPVLALIVCCVAGMMYVGGFWDPTAEGYGDLALAFGNTDASTALPLGSLVALIVSFVYLLARRVVTFTEATDCFVVGFKAMVPAMLILTFALTLKLFTTALGADVYVAGLMEGAAAGLYNLLPAIIFLVALGLSFATGTSWGTFGILIPIVLPIFADQPTLLTIGISACLAGAVCGDHCSPISDTTIMSSAGANCSHLEHVSTQLPYALTVAAASFVSFVVAGFVQNWVVSLAVGIAIIAAVLFVLSKTIGTRVAAQDISAGR